MSTISKHILTADNQGGVHFLPSGSATLAGTAITSLPVAQHFVISCSANTSQVLTPENNSGSLWYFHTPSGYSYQIWYSTTASAALPPAHATTTASLFSPSSQTIYPTQIQVTLDGVSAEYVAERTYEEINNVDSAHKIGIFSVSQSGAYIFISASQGGVSASPTSSTAVGFQHNIFVSGSGIINTSIFEGRPDITLAAASFLFPDSTRSFIISGSGNNCIYMSGSGDKIGFNTTDPLVELDFRADEIQFQKREEPKGLKINQEGNIESYNSSADSAATGSELIIKYSRGTTITAATLSTIYGGEYADDAAALTFYNNLKPIDKSKILQHASQQGFIEPLQVGDVLGSIRWITESGSVDSLDSRTTGEAATITAVVNDSTDQGVRADLIFKVAGKTGAAEQKFLLDAANQHELTGSLNITNILYLPGIPTSDPGVAGAVWRNADNLKISLG